MSPQLVLLSRGDHYPDGGGTYFFSCFHGAHSTGGLGRFNMQVKAQVRSSSPSDWRLNGTAELVPELWNLNGRERRTSMGWTIPGEPFMGFNGHLLLEGRAARR